MNERLETRPKHRSQELCVVLILQVTWTLIYQRQELEPYPVIDKRPLTGFKPGRRNNQSYYGFDKIKKAKFLS